MEARRDEMVAIVQQWLNDTYGKYESSGRFNTIEVGQQFMLYAEHYKLN